MNSVMCPIFTVMVKKCSFVHGIPIKIKNVTKKHHIQNRSACHSDSHAYSVHRADVCDFSDELGESQGLPISCEHNAAHNQDDDLLYHAKNAVRLDRKRLLVSQIQGKRNPDQSYKKQPAEQIFQIDFCKQFGFVRKQQRKHKHTNIISCAQNGYRYTEKFRVHAFIHLVAVECWTELADSACFGTKV